ncbi:pentapeptide repeat-containing protein [Actinopolyspora sp. H202]|uniref:pentapeptide repeat-containing protein n=1 Tax=Actinopolyspora sp. H202 TaxID=1500456 RepID=UPI003EE7E2D8
MTRRAWQWLRDSTWALLAAVVLLAGGLLTWLPIPWATLANQLGQSLAVWGVFRGPGLATLFGTVLLAMIVVARMLTWRRQRRSAEERRPTVRPLRWWWVVLIALAIAAVAGLALWWLMGLAEQSPPKDEPKARIDAVRTALTLGAGLVGIVALVLTSRKQWLAEHTQRHTESDAAEQRATELYTAAAEQLASDKAPVRLAGLYALSRLGQNNPTYRQTIVDLWCAYLRMPYTPPGVESPEESNPDLPDQDKTEQNSNNQQLLLDLAPTLAEAAGLSLDGADKHQQERQVRFTAQRLIAHHQRPNWDEHGQPINPAFWAGEHGTGLDLNLAGAILEHWKFHRCSARTADFTESHFYGPAEFTKTHFHGSAEFAGSQFQDRAGFGGTRFHGIAKFFWSLFHGPADFTGSLFHGPADFTGTRFHGIANFFRSLFHGPADFTGTRFHGIAKFFRSLFHGPADFERSGLYGPAEFTESQFHKRANFFRSQFHDLAYFEGVLLWLEQDAFSESTWPEGWTACETESCDGHADRWGKLVPVDDTAIDTTEGTPELKSAESELTNE